MIALESIWKHPRGNFTKYLFWVFPGKSHVFLQNLRKFSWKIWFVLIVFFLIENCMCFLCAQFWENFPESFYLFLFLCIFFLLENQMYSYRIFKKFSWKFWCVLEISLKKSLPVKKNTYFSSLAASEHTNSIRILIHSWLLLIITHGKVHVFFSEFDSHFLCSLLIVKEKTIILSTWKKK